MKFKIERGREKINNNGGLVLAGAIIKDLKIEMRAGWIQVGEDKPLISNGDVIKAYVGLLCLGKTNFGDIEFYRDDKLFQKALGISKIPSEGTMRQRFDAADGKFDGLISEVNVRLLGKCSPGRIKISSGTYTPLDVDVSVFDNSGSEKEGVGRTYNGTDGYSPNFAYVGTRGYLLHCELRPGKQHCQKGTPEFLGKTLRLAHEAKIGGKILVRMDSGNDSSDNVEVFRGRCDWIIKRNLRKESPDTWLEIAKASGKESRPREGKKVYIGDIFREDERIVFEVTVRDISADGQMLMIPSLDVETFRTSLEDSPEDVIELYHQHGTSEQFHSELKGELDMERLPSGKFGTNRLILLMGMSAYNILRKMGCDLLSYARDLPIKAEMGRRRIRSVLQDIMYTACKYVFSHNRHRIKLGCSNLWFEPFSRLYQKYA